MNTFLLSVPFLIFAAAVVAFRLIRFRTRSDARSRLEDLRLCAAANEPETNSAGVDWRAGSQMLQRMGDRLGRAGFTDSRSRRLAVTLTVIVTLLNVIAFGFLGMRFGGIQGAAAGAVAGAYISATVLLIALRFREKEFERQMMFGLPIFLESVVLLVESGLGILPAIERIVSAKSASGQMDPATTLFHLVYRLSANGMPFGQALETVAESSTHRTIRHVMLHLDITGSEGGELIPSLRSLSDHAHTEWRLSVEQRVKRLENLVVFPVFASVLGLMCLTAAVPMVPLLSLKDSLDNQRRIAPLTKDSGADVPFQAQGEH